MRNATLKAAACTGKQEYQTPQIAWRKTRELKSRHLVFYRCAFCRRFHLGHMGKRIVDDE